MPAYQGAKFRIVAKLIVVVIHVKFLVQ